MLICQQNHYLHNHDRYSAAADAAADRAVAAAHRGIGNLKKVAAMAERSERNSMLFECQKNLRIRGKTCISRRQPVATNKEDHIQSDLHYLPETLNPPMMLAPRVEESDQQQVSHTFIPLDCLIREATELEQQRMREEYIDDDQTTDIECDAPPSKVTGVSEEIEADMVDVANLDLAHDPPGESQLSATDILGYNFEHRVLDNGNNISVTLIIITRKI